MKDANPLSFCSGLSPYLNLYSEPPEFLSEASRALFEPVAFFGSLSPPVDSLERRARRTFVRGGVRRVYVSFGTIIWRYYAASALAAFETIAGVLSGEPRTEVVISLGGAQPGSEETKRIACANVRVEPYVDQWAVLEDADLFITHHGLNSTHESIFHQVPMISYPFFGDQPALARRCQELGLAVALASAPRAAIAAADVERALHTIASDRDGFAARLARGRSFELATIAARSEVIERIVSLIGTPVLPPSLT
jgi:UDP:flavonoid glycosyltransferase YjiC (YdhE family)